MHIPIELSKVLKSWSNKNGLKREIAHTNIEKMQLVNVLKQHNLWDERFLPFKMVVNVLQKDLQNKTNGKGTTKHMAFQINAKAMEKVVEWQMKFM